MKYFGYFRIDRELFMVRFVDVLWMLGNFAEKEEKSDKFLNFRIWIHDGF